MRASANFGESLMNKIGKIVFAAAATATVAVVANAADFGQKVEALAKSQSLSLFGVSGTLSSSSSIQRTQTELDNDPTSAITVAPGLTVRVVSAAANLGFSIDQMVLWPNSSSPTHIIACNEQTAAEAAVQRIDLATGVAQNIISLGMSTCDPVRITPWGTIIVGEETGGGGRLFEILDPLTTSNVAISGSGAATTSSDTAHVRFVSAVGTLSWEVWRCCRTASCTPPTSRVRLAAPAAACSSSFRPTCGPVVHRSPIWRTRR
jgi:hypothetical protein